jgi:hypothetical protein
VTQITPKQTKSAVCDTSRTDKLLIFKLNKCIWLTRAAASGKQRIVDAIVMHNDLHIIIENEYHYVWLCWPNIE